MLKDQEELLILLEKLPVLSLVFSCRFVYQKKQEIMNYLELAFTDAIKKLQENKGSRTIYERMD